MVILLLVAKSVTEGPKLVTKITSYLVTFFGNTEVIPKCYQLPALCGITLNGN